MTNNNKIKFDKANIDQIDFIYNGLLSLAKETGNDDHFSKNKDEIKKSIFHDKIAECIIGYVDSLPAAIALFSVTNRNFNLFPKPGMYLHSVYVLPSFRRQGVGSKLISFLISLAKDKNLGRIDFLVLKNNARAIKFYNKIKNIREVDTVKNMRIKIDT